MSRETVRLAVAAYLRNQNFPGLSILDAMPKEPEPDAPSVPGIATTATLFPSIGTQNEKRLGTGKKQIFYTVTLFCFAVSTQAVAEDAQSDVDGIYEQILAAIRADPTLGTAGSVTPILQAGEGDGLGTADLHWLQDAPFLLNDGATVAVWAGLTITAIEEINA